MSDKRKKFPPKAAPFRTAVSKFTGLYYQGASFNPQRMSEKGQQTMRSKRVKVSLAPLPWSNEKETENGN